MHISRGNVTSEEDVLFHSQCVWSLSPFAIT